MRIHREEKPNVGVTMLRRKCGLSDIRKLAGLTQSEMAEKLDVSQPAYAAFEKGGNLRVGTLQKIISVLGGELQLNIKLNNHWYELSLSEKQNKKILTTNCRI